MRGSRVVASGIPHAFQHRDLADLRWLQVVPEDAARALVLALDFDHRARRSDQVDGKVVLRGHQVLAEDLDRVHGRRHHRVVVDLAGVDQDSVLEVVVAAALADPGAAEVDRDRAAEDEVDLRQLVVGVQPAVLERTLDRRCLFHRLFGQVLGVEHAEGVGVAQARHRHDHGLALFQSDAAGIGLG